MKRIFLALLTLLWLNGNAQQYLSNENKVWTFGRHIGLDFNSGAPVMLAPAGLGTNEGCASVSDVNGILQFYTDGTNVYDRTGVFLLNGHLLAPYAWDTWDAAQAAVIVPAPGNCNRYYIFSLGSIVGHAPGYCKLSYTIVDMTLNGGLGDVIAPTTGTFLQAGLSEKMTAVQGNSGDVWVIVHDLSSPKFYVYNVSAATGVTGPTTYAVGTHSGVGLNGSGVIKVSPDRQKLFCVSYYAMGDELYDFNPATGAISGCQVLTSGKGYGAEFSPDSKKLYTTNRSLHELYQFDISLSPTAAINGSRVTIGSSCDGDMRLAPDGKIYVTPTHVPGNYLSCISYPNAAGTACGYVATALTFPAASVEFGLPNIVPANTAITGPSSLCLGATAAYTDGTLGGTWSEVNGTGSATITSAGVLTGSGAGSVTVIYTFPGGCIVTYPVIIGPAAPIVGPLSLCAGASAAYSDAVPGGTWSEINGTGSATITSGGVLTGIAAGNVTLTYTVTGGCSVTYPVVIFPSAPIVGPAAICIGSGVAYSDLVPGGTWSETDGTGHATVTSSGVLTGISNGSVALTYSLPGGCDETLAIIVGLAPTITGPVSLCLGASAAYSDPGAGGTWSETNGTGSATITPAGVLTGVSAGNVTLTYSLPGGCDATFPVAIGPAAPIVGPSHICEGSSLPYSDGMIGGT